MKSLNVAVLSLLLFAGAAANGRPTAGDPAAPVKTETGKDSVTAKADVLPSFRGGPERLAEYLRVNLRYPKEEVAAGTFQKADQSGDDPGAFELRLPDQGNQ